MCENRNQQTEKKKIFLVGIGMGTAASLTGQAKAALERCDYLIGARRMLETFREMRKIRQNPDKPGESGTEEEPEYAEAYVTEEIVSLIQEQKKRQCIGVLFSGDTGFYSGAGKLAQRLAEFPGLYDVEVIPGISSVCYLAARLQTAWEDASIVSLHGREENFIQTVSRSARTFLLLGGKDTGSRMLQKLREYGLDDVTVRAGSRLSYPDEKIISGRPSELSDKDVEGLCTALIENPRPENRGEPHIRDDAFIRGKVPMTKEEVRAVSLARLNLTGDAVVYDVGAGTGSVSVEAARCSDRIRVYAVEKNPRALELLAQNRRKFRADGIRIIEGQAPEALDDLEPPTHVFIGGSGGRLQEILKAVIRKNPRVRIVINAISMETIKEVMDAGQEGLLPHMEIIQMCVSRSRELAGYHMMTGLNPVHIISAGGEEPEADSDQDRGRI